MTDSLLHVFDEVIIVSFGVSRLELVTTLHVNKLMRVLNVV